MTAATSHTVGLSLAVRRRGRGFMLCFAGLVVAAVLTGFGRTFFMPLAQGRFEQRPWFVHIHGALFFIWVALLLVQVWLAARRQMCWHQRLGTIGFLLVPVMAGSGIAVSVWATQRDIALRQADAIPFFFGQLMDMLLFSAFASAALLLRHRPAVHKRFILFATIAILGAALGRIPVVGSVANPVAVALVLAIGAYDLAVERRVRPVSYVGGLLLLAGIYSETPLGETRAWERLGPAVLAFFSST